MTLGVQRLILSHINWKNHSNLGIYVFLVKKMLLSCAPGNYTNPLEKKTN